MTTSTLREQDLELFFRGLFGEAVGPGLDDGMLYLILVPGWRARSYIEVPLCGSAFSRNLLKVASKSPYRFKESVTRMKSGDVMYCMVLIPPLPMAASMMGCLISRHLLIWRLRCAMAVRSRLSLGSLSFSRTTLRKSMRSVVWAFRSSSSASKRK